MNRITLTAKETGTVIGAVIVIFISALAIGWNFGYQGADPWYLITHKSSFSSNYLRAMNLIHVNYDGSIDEEAISLMSLRSLIAALHDPYSYYLTKPEYEKLKAADSGQSIGIGVQYVIKNKFPVVLRVFADSPAFFAEIHPGDTITAVNHEALNELSNETEVLNRIRGRDGERSIITILDSNHTSRDISITRKLYRIPTFEYKNINADTSYVQLYQFSPTLVDEFADIKKRILSDKPKRLIVDLRNNLGGDTKSAVFFVDQFLKKGIIVREKWKQSKSEEITYASGKAEFSNISLIILVNNETSSAAEIVTAAIQDNKRGTVVGQKTYGKGTAGYFFDLSDGSAVHLTIGKWLTPQDIWIQGKGIQPDIEVISSEDSSADDALSKATTL